MEPPEDAGSTVSSAFYSSFIKDGAVSGVIPAAEAFAIHYPGYPSSTARAIETLGGLPEIAKVWSTESTKLELRFRPEDPYCHPAFGELRPAVGLLLRIRRTREKSIPPGGKDGGDESGQGGNPSKDKGLSAQVVSTVKNAYHFDGMADYQHVPAVHAAKARTKKRQRAPDNDSISYEGHSTDVDQSDVMMLVPPLFSPKDRPTKIVLNPPDSFLKNNHKSIAAHNWEMDMEPWLELPFDIEKIPKKVNWEDYVPKDTPMREYQNALSKLFEERPIWPRLSLEVRLMDSNHHISESRMRRLLARAGYYFSTGPFRTFWIRKGYDPRDDPESRIYQVIEFRSQLKDLCNANSKIKLKQIWKQICRFEVWPSKQSVRLQLFELDDNFIQEEIRKPTTQTTCDPSTGWFSKPMINMLLQQVKLRFLSLYPDQVAERVNYNRKLGRYKKEEALNRLKNSEKQDTLNKVPNPCDEFLTAGSSVPELMGHDGPDSSEIDDSEEEEVDLDDDESAPLEHEGNFFQVDDDSYGIGEGLQNDYLQELLRGFPFNQEDQDEKNDFSEGNDDTEYPIYEQESNESEND